MMDAETRRKLREIGVPELADALDLVDGDPSYAALPPQDRLRTAVDHAWQAKYNASVRKLLGRAHLRIPEADISGVIYEGRPLDRDRILSLGTRGFVDTATDIIIEGFTGTGKSYLACALAKQACKHRIGALYVRLPDMFMYRDEWTRAGKGEDALLRKYEKFRVLVLDEWLIDPLTADQVRFLFELVERRCDRSSNILCTQYPVPDWHGRLGGGVHADSIMDRIVHNAVRLETGKVNMREATAPRFGA